MIKTIIATTLLTTTAFAAQSNYTPTVKAAIITTVPDTIDQPNQDPNTPVVLQTIVLETKQPEPEPSKVNGFVKVDQDYMSGIQLSAFATYSHSEHVGVAVNVLMAENYVYQTDAGPANSYWGEIDVGMFFNYKSLTLTPMVGIVFDFSDKKTLALTIPQLDVIISTDKWYFESWNYSINYSAFEKNLGDDYVHTRNWLLYKPNDLFSFGPQVEWTYGIQHKHTIYGLPIGGHIEGDYNDNSLGIFLGYDVSPATNDNGKVAGRITLTHYF
jgi:hypothetical protein